MTLTFKIDTSIVQENTHANFFNYPYNASSEEILYIYFHLKDNYPINLDSLRIKEGEFESIDRICELLE